MFCSNCGKKIDDNSKFCQFCGSLIKDNVSQSMTHQQPQIPVGKKINPLLVGGIGLGCLAVVLCGVRLLSSDKQDSPAEVAVMESAPVEDNTDEPVSTPADDTEVEETDTGNKIYFLTESDVTSQLKGFFNFCWSNSAFNNDRDLGQDTINLDENCFRSLYAVTVDKSMDVGVVAIYETNPRLILTSDFAETCLAGGCSDLDALIIQCCRNINSIEFKGSNIDKLWHFYEGTDECVYVAVSVGDYNFTIEMVQCTGDPHEWLINNVDMHLNQDLLDVKLKNEDGVQDDADNVTAEQSDWIATYKDYFSSSSYIMDAQYFNVQDLNQDGIPEVFLDDPYSMNVDIFPALFYIDADGAVNYVQHASQFYQDMIYCSDSDPENPDVTYVFVYQYDNNTGSYIKIFEDELDYSQRDSNPNFYEEHDEKLSSVLNEDDLLLFSDSRSEYCGEFWTLADDSSMFTSVLEGTLISWQKDNN